MTRNRRPHAASIVSGCWRFLLSALLPVLLLTASCAEKKTPELGPLYNQAAQNHDGSRNPVIIIPGLMGSRLVDQDGQLIWGAFDRQSMDPRTAEGARAISLPMRSGTPLSELVDDIVADGVLDRIQIRIMGIPLLLRAYANILQVLGVQGGYRDETLKLEDVDYGSEHFTCFQFAWDWRRDIAENAAALDRFIREKKIYVERELLSRYGIKKDVQFDLVAHSMGGLVARYFLRYGGGEPPPPGTPVPWSGAPLVQQAILIGVPNAGSVAALRDLVDGFDPGPTLPKYSSALIGTFPGPYQLLPRPRHRRLVDAESPGTPILDFMEAAFWIEQGWGLANPKQDATLKQLLPEIDTAAARREVALDHLEKVLSRAERITDALDVPAQRPQGLELYLVAGDSEPTAAVLGLDLRSGQLTTLERLPGDGTVSRASALMDERLTGIGTRDRLQTPIDWTHVSFIFNDHLGLTKDPVFIDNLLFLLLER